MTRYLVTLRSTADRERAMRLVNVAPFGSRVEVKAAKRSMPQNDRMWAMLTEVARQVKWDGQTLRPDDWKEIFLHSLKRELRMVKGLDDQPIILGRSSSSDLTKSEMSDLIELIYSFGANPNHSVVFLDTEAA